MSKTKFNIGDIVKLKSGGPDMTVKKLNENVAGTILGYTCQWFAGKKLEDGSFPPESIELVSKDKEK